MNVTSIDTAIVFVLHAQLELTICAKYNPVAKKKHQTVQKERNRSVEVHKRTRRFPEPVQTMAMGDESSSILNAPLVLDESVIPGAVLSAPFERHTENGGFCVGVSNQRREDMTSRRSDNLHALITFQGQESWMQVSRIALWTKSRPAQGVFY